MTAVFSALVTVCGTLLAGVAGLLLWGEFVNWRASHSMIGDPRGSREVIVVLGFRNSASKANVLNRWRVRAGLRSRDRVGNESAMIFSGGAVAGAASEAELMAEYARRCGYLGPVELETVSRSTRENVECVIPLLERAERIKIVSNPMHAAQARSYLFRIRPDLAARLARGADYRFGEWIVLKPLFAVVGYRKSGRAGR